MFLPRERGKVSRPIFMINCEGEFNGQKVVLQLALPLTKMAEAPGEVYFDDLRIEIKGLGVLKIPLSKIHEALSTQNILMQHGDPASPKVRAKVVEPPYKKPETEAKDNVSDFEEHRRKKAK